MSSYLWDYDEKELRRTESGRIFTPEQKIILGKIIKNDFLRENFYFTGGSALSEYVLSYFSP